MMTTMVGSALALGACGNDAETTEKETPTEEVTTDTAEEPRSSSRRKSFRRWIKYSCSNNGSTC